MMRLATDTGDFGLRIADFGLRIEVFFHSVRCNDLFAAKLDFGVPVQRCEINYNSSRNTEQLS